MKRLPLPTGPGAAVLLTLVLAASPVASQTATAWREARAPGLRVLSQLEAPATERLTRQLAGFRSYLAALGLPGSAPQLPLTVWLFASREAWGPYRLLAPLPGSELQGQFLHGRFRGVAVVNATEATPGGVRSLLYHEALHAALGDGRGMPLWLHEGLAEYYSTFRWEGGAVAEVGRPITHHVLRLRSAGLALETLDGAAAGEAGEPADLFYARAWILVHYLLASGEVPPRRAPGLWSRLAAGEPLRRAVPETYGFDLPALGLRLRAYLGARSLPFYRVRWGGVSTLPVDVRTMNPQEVRLQRALFLVGASSQVRAAAAAAEAQLATLVSAAETGADAYAAWGWLRQRQGRVRAAARLFARAERRGPRGWLAHLLVGQWHLRRLSDGDAVSAADLTAGRRALRRALELEPAAGEAWALLGSSYVYSGDDPARGARILERALELLPSRDDVAYNLVLARLQAGDTVGARRLADRRFRPAGGWVGRAAWRAIATVEAGQVEASSTAPETLFGDTSAAAAAARSD